MLTRRQFASSTLAVAGSLFLPNVSGAASGGTTALIEAIKQLELKSGGRLGVSVLDPTTGVPIHYKGDERFPMCSTFKVLAAAAILKDAGSKLERLERRIRIEQTDIVENSPVTREHVGGEGMSLRELCDAAMTRSDNTAGNTLLKNIGGPAGLTSFARSLGDKMTRLDRTETELNEAAPGDPRDTTTPNAMAANLRRLLLGDVLLPQGRDQLGKWLIANKTGVVGYAQACRKAGVWATRPEQASMAPPMTSPSCGRPSVRRSSSRFISPAPRSTRMDETT